MRRSLPVAPLLFAAAALLSASTMLHGIQPNDEGLMLQAAARIAHGELPYRDFWWFYPPGQPLLLGGLWALLGPSLLTWRVLRVLCDALVAVLAWRLALRGGASPRLALVSWLAAALAMAFPSGPHPFPVTLALALGALLTFERRPAPAGLLAGVTAFWRLEFAAYLGLGILLAYAARRGPERLRPATRFAGAAVGTALALYAPVLLATGLGPALDLLVRYPLEDFSAYQSLPFPLHFPRRLHTGSPGDLISDVFHSVLLFHLPLALMLGLAGSLVALAARLTRDRSWQLATAVLAIGMAHYLVTRADYFHTAPLAVLGSVLAAWALAERRAPAGEAGGARGARRAAPVTAAPRARAIAAAAATTLAGLALAYAVVEGASRRWLELRAHTAPLRLDVADGVRIDPAERTALERAVADLRRRVPPGAPTYVATRRADLVTSGSPLLYVLAGRANATRYDIAAPGIVTSAPVQREIVADLERTRPPAVVRDTSAATAAPEPNLAGRSSGVRILDEYLARAYRPAARYGPFTILQRRGSR